MAGKILKWEGITMQFVKTENLKPGMRLAKPIYNRMGVLLYDRNTQLTPQGINSIQKFSLIGIYILEPAEPAPPLTKEEIHFEQFQTIYMFRLRDELDKIAGGNPPDKLHDLAVNILKEYGNLNPLFPEHSQFRGFCIQTWTQRCHPLCFNFPSYGFYLRGTTGSGSGSIAV